MTTLILNVDRDNDYGIKAGVDGPVTGYGECYNAALKLISVDPEDSDANALFGALSSLSPELTSPFPTDAFFIISSRIRIRYVKHILVRQKGRLHQSLQDQQRLT